MATQELPRILDDLRTHFHTGITRPLAWRKDRLKKLKLVIQEQEAALSAALKEDLGKSAFESWTAETNFVVNEIDHTLAHLAEWMEAEEVPTPAWMLPAHSQIIREPLGVALIIAPWNYPAQLALAPLATALAAGNLAVLKPSEIAPATSAALAAAIPRYFDSNEVVVVEGGVPETTALLEQPWDIILFTGSTRVGKVVMEAASKHLTPVILELGGKSPCIVDETARLKVAARRIAWGKYYNTGQTCVAPDYVLVHQSREREFLDVLGKTITEFFGDDPKSSPDLGRIVNERHHARLVSYLGGGEVAIGGEHDVESRYFAPTVLTGVDLEAPIMQDEIFGPILPVIPYKDLDEAIRFVNERPKPLALYVFSQKKRNQQAVLSRTSSGGACVNQTVLHLGNPDLPFGGVGPSGMGAYHGRAGFEAFSHRKSVLNRGTLLDAPVIYPPYTDTKQKITRILV